MVLIALDAALPILCRDFLSQLWFQYSRFSPSTTFTATSSENQHWLYNVFNKIFFQPTSYLASSKLVQFLFKRARTVALGCAPCNNLLLHQRQEQLSSCLQQDDIGQLRWVLLLLQLWVHYYDPIIGSFLVPNAWVSCLCSSSFLLLEFLLASIWVIFKPKRFK